MHNFDFPFLYFVYISVTMWQNTVYINVLQYNISIYCRYISSLPLPISDQGEVKTLLPVQVRHLETKKTFHLCVIFPHRKKQITFRFFHFQVTSNNCSASDQVFRCDYVWSG
jgi:hypothetical protein